MGLAADPIRIVFLGDKGHHRPSDFAGRIAPPLKARGIDIEYTEDISILSDQRLKNFDGLLVYANIDEISKDQEAALLRFVESGKGSFPFTAQPTASETRKRISPCVELSLRATAAKSLKR